MSDSYPPDSDRTSSVDELFAKVEALEERVRELEERLAALEPAPAPGLLETMTKAIETWRSDYGEADFEALLNAESRDVAKLLRIRKDCPSSSAAEYILDEAEAWMGDESGALEIMFENGLLSRRWRNHALGTHFAARWRKEKEAAP